MLSIVTSTRLEVWPSVKNESFGLMALQIEDCWWFSFFHDLILFVLTLKSKESNNIDSQYSFQILRPMSVREYSIQKKKERSV